ncbi:MAG: hypothetical protein ACLQMO_07070 [Acidobacteriaceae bacterium]
MEILYGTTMAAIFVLCLVLLWTSRRVLRSSPITGHELSLTRLHELINQSEIPPESDCADTEPFVFEQEGTEISPSLISPVVLETMSSEENVAGVAIAEEIPASEEAPAQMQEQSLMDFRLNEIAESSEIREQSAVLPPMFHLNEIAESSEIRKQPAVLPPMFHLNEIAESSEIIEQSEAEHNDQITERPSTEHNHLLEYLLLALSVFVLVRMQTGKTRDNRTLQSSDQVA